MGGANDKYFLEIPLKMLASKRLVRLSGQGVL